MLLHHLFFSPSSRALYDDIIVHGIGIVNQIGIYSKLCVAVFVFVSGYGLVVSTSHNIKLKDFYFRRFKKLYLNYWFIWLFFVPISVFVFGRSFSDVYGDHAVYKAVLDFMGLVKILGIDSYNPTWWFYSCIIILYLLFPILNIWLWKSPYLVVSIAATIGLMGNIPGINVIKSFLFVFIVGMIMAKIPLKWIDSTNCHQIIIALALLSVWRFTKTSPRHIVDSLLCVGIALFVYKVNLYNWISIFFEELGKHSMNMFLTHTFIYYLWFGNYIYITRNPFLIFVSLLATSYLLSVLIEWIKKKIGFYKI